jgi:DNA-binding transcriptional ArsR family regulator
MPLSRPLEVLISPDLAKILTVLDQTGQPLTGRMIATLTGTVSQSTTSRLLIELVRRGLVAKVPGGYEMNRDHLAYQAIAMLRSTRDELQRRVAEDLAAWEIPPLSVVLFGSAARQQETLDSDIDLLDGPTNNSALRRPELGHQGSEPLRACRPLEWIDM